MRRDGGEVPEASALRESVEHAISQALAAIDLSDKESLRAAHAPAVQQSRSAAQKALASWEPRLLKNFASGREVDPERISPALVRVRTEPEKRLFRYAASHWSIPVSNGYGRRLRFLVVDETTEKLIGLIGLGDPVFALRDRDQWIGWLPADRLVRLRCVLDAFVLGAVPPYSYLLGGKLVATLATSADVQDAFWETYGQRRALISGTEQSHPLVMLTTTSAYGRSSMYNRLRLQGRTFWQAAGFTAGHGEFLFSGRLYEQMRLYVEANARPSARHENWGPEAWRNRREVVRKALVLLHLPLALHIHGLERSVYVAPLGETSREFLAGATNEPNLIRRSTAELAAAALERWIVPRSIRTSLWRHWEPSEFRLWGSG
jgi:hypothetical protein